MDYVKLGSTGLDVSRLCLGAMGFGDPTRWIHPWVLEGGRLQALGHRVRP